MHKEIDARGMNCPLPVIHTKKALEAIDQGRVTAIVDNEVAKENVSKLAKSLNYKTDIKEIQGLYYIDILKNEELVMVEEVDLSKGSEAKKDLVLLISQDHLGEGSEELGKVLMKGYIYALTEVSPFPKSILLLNGGVRLATEGSEAVEYLKDLEEKGVEILVCGTCLDYFNIKRQLLVGGVSNMYTIVEKLNNASNTIKL